MLEYSEDANYFAKISQHRNQSCVFGANIAKKSKKDSIL